MEANAPAAQEDSKCPSCGNHREPTSVITPRIPKSLHGRLVDEAHERRVSLNKLCIEYLKAGLPSEADLFYREQQRAAAANS